MDGDDKYNIESKVKSKEEKCNEKKGWRVTLSHPMVSTLVPYCWETSVRLAREKPDSGYATGNS